MKRLLNRADTNIDKLIESYNNAPSSFFLSTWNCEIIEDFKDPQLICSIIEQSNKNNALYKYFFWDELDKKKFISFCTHKYNVVIPADNLTLASNGTSSIFLTLRYLRQTHKNVCILTPNYFTTINLLFDFNYNVFNECIINNGKVFFNQDDFIDDLNRFSIDLLILINPLFATGINILQILNKKLIKYINKNKITVLIDNMYGGMEWECDLNIFDILTYKKIVNLNNYILIDSPAKRLLLNGCKFSIILSNIAEFNMMIEKDSVSYIGSMASSQIALYNNLFTIEFQPQINRLLNNTISIAKQNYEFIKNYTRGSMLNLIPCHSGYFCLAYCKKRHIDDLDNSIDILTNYNLFTIPHSRYIMNDDDYYYFRINLLLDITSIIESLSKLIQK